MQEQNTRVELRPGVFRPDWSVARSPAAREALSGRAQAREGLLDKWMRALEPEQDRVWQAVLALYGSLGRPPTLSELRDRTGLSEASLVEAMRELERCDLLKRNDQGAIRYAYPFTQDWSGHTVLLGGRELGSLCAIDALGTGAMFEDDVTVQSTCRHCGAPIRAVTAEHGSTIREVAPPDAVVWYDCSCGESAASSCCQSIAFFCSDAHLRVWLDQAPTEYGTRLTVSEALEVGRAIFGPVLQEALASDST
jgi:alkylmercury lyase